VNKLLATIALGFIIASEAAASADPGLSVSCNSEDPNDGIVREMEWTVNLRKKSVDQFKTVITGARIQWWMPSETVILDRRTSRLIRRSTVAGYTDQASKNTCHVASIDIPPSK